MRFVLVAGLCMTMVGCGDRRPGPNQQDIALLTTPIAPVVALEYAEIGEWVYAQDRPSSPHIQVAAVKSEHYWMGTRCLITDTGEKKAIVMLYSRRAEKLDGQQHITWLFDGQRPLEILMDPVHSRDDEAWGLETDTEPGASLFHNRAGNAANTITAMGVPALAGDGTVKVDFAVDAEIASMSNCQR